MKFIHSTLIPQSDIHQCLSLGSDVEGTTRTLLFYKCRAIYCTFHSDQGISYEKIREFTIETPILWCHLLGENRLICVNEKYEIIITNLGNSFERIGFFNLSDNLAKPKKLSIFALSNDMKYLCLTCKNANFCLIVKLENPSEMKVANLDLDDWKVLDLTSVGDCFVILLENENNDNKIFKKINCENLDTNDIENAIMDIKCFIKGKTEKVSFITDNYFSLEDYVVETQNKIISCSEFDGLNFVCLLDNGNLGFYKTTKKTFLEIHECPIVNGIWMLPNSLVILNQVNDFNMIIKIPEQNNETNELNYFKYFNDTNRFQFNALSTKGFSNNEKLLLNTSDNNLFEFSMSLKLSEGENIVETDEEYNNLFALDSSSIIGSSDKNSTVIFGKSKISKERTIALINFDNKNIQICPNGIFLVDGKKLETFKKKAIAASSNDEHLVIAFENKKIILYTKKISKKTNFFCDFDDIRAISLSDYFICIASSTKLVLFDLEFEELPFEHLLPSPPVSILFLNNDELFVSMENGAIGEYFVSSTTGFLPDISYIYYGKKGLKIMKITNESLLILDTNLFIYKNYWLHKIDLEDYQAVLPLPNEINSKFILCILKNGNLSKYTINLNELCNLYKIENIKSNMFFSNEEKIFFISELDNKYSIVCENRNISSEPHFGKVLSYTSFNNYIIIGIEKEIHVYTFTDANITFMFNFQLKQPPIKLSHILNYLVIFTESFIQVANIRENTIILNQTLFSIPEPASLIASNGFLWVVLGNSLIITLIYNPETYSLEVISYDKYQNIECLSIVDDLTAAISNNKGTITFLRIKNDIAHGFPNNNKYTYNNICEIFTNTKIHALLKHKDLLIYLTKDGEVGAFSLFTNCSNFEQLRSLQSELHQQYIREIGFSSQNLNTFLYQTNIIDLNTILESTLLAQTTTPQFKQQISCLLPHHNLIYF